MQPNQQPMELWGGVECTINRVGDRYFNQLERSGHSQRVCRDLERFADLGVRALRFPILWESISPNDPNEFDWTWPDVGLGKLRDLGIRPIAGLLHHGSGPHYTSLVDPAFPEKLAHYAAAVARRYPWIDMYTPVNEPLTTARFSGLYGHWYPHVRDARVFADALLNQVRGTVLAMRAVRMVNPQAQLVQTEDFGRTFSTPRLRYQADFENERRWLTWDLLRGELTPDRPMWQYLTWLGIAPATLDFFRHDSCAPDIIGINYYVTSERYLDEKVDRYPREHHGGNGRDVYADDAAVRARPQGLAGAGGAIREVQRRYRAPIALTEVHLGCSVDEQMRWFKEMWDAAQTARRDDVDLRAVTAWALLGSFDWNNLATCCDGHYEPGAFDVRTGEPAPTALAQMLSQLARGEDPGDETLTAAGWWHHPSRLRFADLDASDCELEMVA